MERCPQCGAEVIGGGAECGRCGFRKAELRSGGEEREATLQLVEVLRAANEMEAQLIRGLLESHSIPCTLRGEALRLTHSITVDGLAEVKVLVRPDDLKKAREIIASADLESDSETE